jgi:hypothetical protein
LTAFTIAECIPSATWCVNSTEICSNPAAVDRVGRQRDLFDHALQKVHVRHASLARILLRESPSWWRKLVTL